MRSQFVKGMADGIPIMLGYFSVSIGFGILAVRSGLSILEAVGISASNLTSAGQAAGVSVIAAGGTLIEMAISQLVINLRYALMGVSLSQKLSPDFRLYQRLISAFGITDEIFAVAVSKTEPVTAKYMYGLILTPFIGWTTGTLVGAAAGGVLPSFITNALGIMLYGMFIAIIMPVSKKDHRVMAAVIIAAGLSVAISYLLPFISTGFAVIICALAASVLCALLFPVKEENN